ncbi:hypothetical protein FI667_g3373, partial [Globisporangium splendens]
MTTRWWNEGKRDGGDSSSAMLAAAQSFVDEYESSVASDSDDARPPSLGTASTAQGEVIAEVDWCQDVAAAFQFADGHASASSSPALVASASLEASTPPVQHMSSISSTAKELHKKPRRGDPNKWRIERKQEMIHLRIKVSELEAELQEMRQQKKSRSALPTLGCQVHAAEEGSGQGLRFVIPLSAVPSTPTVASVWKAIADNQYNERARSERENVRLKLVLENQLRIANNLQRLLNKSTATRDIEKCIYQSKGVHTACPPTANWVDNYIFEDLLAGISIMYSEIDSMLAAISLEQIKAPHVTAKILTDENQDMRIEVLGKKEFPFDIHATGAAVWSHFLSAKERIPFRHYFHTTPKKINAEEGTIHESFILELQLNKTSIRYRMKQILRRYVEKDRVVVIWRGYFDPIELSGTPITGAQFMAKGFVVVKRPKTDLGDASLVQTCYHIKPELSGDLTDSTNPLRQPLEDTFVDEYEPSMVASDSGDDALPPSLVSASAAQGELVLDGLAAIDEQVDVRTVDANASNTGSSLLPVALVPLDGNSPAIQQDARTSLTAKKSCKKPTRSDPNKSRNARKQELIYLRSKVSDLEAQLRDMHKQKYPRDSPSSSSLWHRIHSAEERNDQDLRFSIPLSAAGSSFRPTAVSVWKEIADSQSNERMRSERENTRLKLLLGSQLRIANNLQKLLNKSTGTRGVHNVHPPTANWTTDSQIFDYLLAGVPVMYSEIDAVLAVIRLAQSEAPRVDAKMLTDESHGQVMEVLGNKVFPFDIHTTGAAVWDHFVSMKERIPYRHYYHTTPKKINAEEDTILENCILDMQLNQTSGRFHIKQILRRYVERDRVVVIWRACFNPVELSGEPITGVQFVEKGFIVVKRPKINWGNMSLLQTCYIAKPELTGDMKENPLVKSMLDFVLRTTAGNITASHQMIENELLEQTLRTSNRVS